MAESDSIYLPRLEPCLRRESILLSWQAAYSALGDNADDVETDAGLIGFLTDAMSKQLLCKALNPFSRPSAASRSQFETLTSAINVTPNHGGPYDVTSIKDDTLWLSKQANIDEVAALRIVVLEWQGRPKTRLLLHPSTDESQTDQELLLGKSLKFAPLVTKSPVSLDAEPTDGFDSRDERRLRQLKLYLSEHVHILKTSELLLSLHKPGHDIDPLTHLGTDIAGAFDEENDARHRNLQELVTALQARMENLDSGSGWYTSEGGNIDVEIIWINSQIIEMALILQIISSMHFAFHEPVSSASVLAYFKFMDSCHFFSDFHHPLAEQSSIQLLQSLVCTVSPTFLLPSLVPATRTELDDSVGSAGFVNSPTAISELNLIIFKLADGEEFPTPPTAVLAIYAWAVFLHWLKEDSGLLTEDRGTMDASVSFPSVEPERLMSLSGRVLDECMMLDIIANAASTFKTAFWHPKDDETHARLRSILLSMIQACLIVTTYGPELFGTLLDVLTGEGSYWDAVDLGKVDSVVLLFVDNPELTLAFFDEAAARFPLETIPFVKLLRIVFARGTVNWDACRTLLKILNDSDQFTQTLNPDFLSYDHIEEDFHGSDSYKVRLKEDMPIFVSRRYAVPSGPNDPSNHSLVRYQPSAWLPTISVPGASVGAVIDDSKRPIVVSWKYEYSRLNYMITGLATALPNSTHAAYSSMDGLPMDEVTEIISLINVILASLNSCKEEQIAAREEALNILQAPVDNYSGSRDLISAIFDIFEYHLQQSQEQSAVEEAIDLLSQCVQFFHAAAVYLPLRIWPLLERSRLLGVDSSDCGLVAITSAVEMISGRYEFLISCIRLFDSLIEISYTHRNTPAPTNPGKALTRFGSEANLRDTGFNLPLRTIREVLTRFLRTLLSVFESCSNWRFTSAYQQFEISTRLATAFEKIIRYAYGFDDEPDLHKKFTGVLADSAELLTGVFLSVEHASVCTTLLEMLEAGVSFASIPNHGKEHHDAMEQAKASVELCSIIIQVGTYLDRPTSGLQTQLFKGTSALAQLFVASESLKQPVAVLLETLLHASTRHEANPSSLLGHMGADMAKNFLSVLTQMNHPLEKPNSDLAVWNMLTAVVSSQQQWFATYLLTGKPPREGARSAKTENGEKGGAVFSYALDRLSNVQELDRRLALVMLKFVANSYNNWPWAVHMVRRHKTFFKGITQHFGRLRRENNPPVIQTCLDSAIAASIAEIITMYLHTCRQLGDVEPATSLINKLGYFKNFGFRVPEYRASLHTLLSNNLGVVCPGLKLTNFKHTLAFPVEFGPNYFYDVRVASKTIDASRTQVKANLRGSFDDDLQIANMDLSLVQSQLLLMEKCKMLAIELSQVAAAQPELVEPLIDVITLCLQETDWNGLPQAIIDTLRKSRVELALRLLQKLVSIDTKSPDLTKIFPLAWNAVLLLVQNFETVYLDEEKDTYRQLLRILFLSLQPLVRSGGTKHYALKSPGQLLVPPANSPQLLEVLQQVVINGFKSLATLLHEDASACEPADFALLTAILQAILGIPGVELLFSQISLQLANNNTSRHAISLFSWASQLLIDGDPIYGELSILFLVEISSIPLVAENLAVEGILSQLSSANLMQLFMRPTGMGPFDNPYRMHSIWSRGILPICLNLLDAVGPPVAGEVVSFLNQFPNQLRRLSTALANRGAPIGTRPTDGHLTLNMAAEAHSLALLSLIIDRYRAAGAGTGTLAPDIPTLVWDRSSVKEDVEDWIQGRTALRDRILPANERDSKLARTSSSSKHGRSIAENVLEERVFVELRGALDCFVGVGNGLSE